MCRQFGPCYSHPSTVPSRDEYRVSLCAQKKKAEVTVCDSESYVMKGVTASTLFSEITLGMPAATL